MCNDLSRSYHCSSIDRKANYEAYAILYSFLGSYVSTHIKAYNCYL